MRVILLSPNFYPRVGGIESHLVEVVRNIRDVEFIVLTNARRDAYKRSALFPKISFADVWPSDLEIRKWFLSFPPSLRVGQSFGALLEFLRTRNRLGWLRRLEADVVHAHYFDLDYMDRAARLLGRPNLIRRRYETIAAAIEGRAPLLYTDHTIFTADTELIPEATKEALLRSMKNIVSVDRGSHEVVRAYQSRHEGRRSWFIPNSVDTEVFRPNGASKDDFTVGFAARVGKLGEDLMQQVIRLVGDQVRWHIALGGENVDLERASLAPMIPKSQFFTNLDYERMPAFYNSVDVLLNPFPGQGVGRTTLEAMACAVPVISVGTSDKYPVLPEKTGLLVPPDPRVIAQAILRLRNDDGLVNSLGQKARSVIVNEFSNGVLLPKLRDVYSTLSERC